MIYDYIIKQFVGRDINKHSLHKPRLIDGYVYASDAYSLIRVPAEKCAMDYSGSSEFPVTATKIFEDITEAEPLRIGVDQLAKTLAKALFDYQMNECEKCKGEGTIVCQCCGHENDCSHCNGDGHTDQVTDFAWKHDSDIQSVRVGTRFFRPWLLDRLLQTAFALRADHITMVNDRADTFNVMFTMCDVEIIICPQVPENVSVFSAELEVKTEKPW